MRSKETNNLKTNTRVPSGTLSFNGVAWHNGYGGEDRMRTKREGRPIDILGSRHMMSIILFLSENGPSKRTDIYDAVSKNTNMPEKFDILIDQGIIEETHSIDGRMLVLTDSGEEIAGMLQSVEDRLRSS